MYWTVTSLLFALESHLWFLTFFIPFYAYLRIPVLLYLVLPQTQGARIIYQTHLHPFLAHHEAQIETWIGSAHERIRGYGGEWVEYVIQMVREKVFGARPESRAASAYPGTRSGSEGAQGYVQGLMQRFSLPAASAGLAAPAGDFYGLLSAAASTMGRGAGSAGPQSSEAQIDMLLRQGGLVPSHITTTAERARFLGTQRQKLSVLLGALDKEAGRLEGENGREGAAAAGADIGRSKSEASFEKIEGEDLAYGAPPPPKKQGEGWLGGWFGGGQEEKKKKEE